MDAQDLSAAGAMGNAHADRKGSQVVRVRIRLVQAALYFAALSIVGGIVWSGAEGHWLSGQSWLVFALLATCLVMGIHLTWHIAEAYCRDAHVSGGRRYGREEEASPARLRADLIPRQWVDAHTFIYFDPASQVSLTLNVRDIDWCGPCDLKVFFLQPLEKDTVVVRPFGGTPRLEVLACDDRHLHLRFALAPVAVKLRVLGTPIPLVTNHYPGKSTVRRTAWA